MRDFSRHYAARLQPAVPLGRTFPEKEWKDRLGKASAYPDYLAFYSDRMTLTGRPALLAEYLPRLLPGLPGGTFHVLIMLAYALEWGDDHFLSEAMAYFSSAYEMLEPPAHRERSARFPGWILEDLGSCYSAQ